MRRRNWPSGPSNERRTNRISPTPWALSPDDPMVHYHYSLALAEIGKKSLAKAEFRDRVMEASDSRRPQEHCIGIAQHEALAASLITWSRSRQKPGPGRHRRYHRSLVPVVFLTLPLAWRLAPPSPSRHERARKLSLKAFNRRGCQSRLFPVVCWSVGKPTTEGPEFADACTACRSPPPRGLSSPGESVSNSGVAFGATIGTWRVQLGHQFAWAVSQIPHPFILVRPVAALW